jgi:hypothetical protein
MPKPKVVPGGELHVMSGGRHRGQFSGFPGATPKYAINRGARDAENRESMARLFIEIPEKKRAAFINSVPHASRPLARVLCGGLTGRATGFIDFLMTAAQEAFSEKYQVVETLSDNFIVYFFGQRAPTFQYSGTLLNTYQDDQRVWMMRLYQDILRGTQLARRKLLVRLRYDSVIVTGMLIAHGQAITGDAVDHASFNFSMIPTHYTIFSPSVCDPTQLRTAATPGSAYMLQETTDDVDPRRLRVVASANPPQPSKKPAAAQTATSTPGKKPVTKTAAQKLKDRADQKTEKKTLDAAVYEPTATEKIYSSDTMALMP